MTEEQVGKMCRCEWPNVGPGIYPRCLTCEGWIDPPPSEQRQVATRWERLAYKRRRLTVRHPLTGERLWRIRFRMWWYDWSRT